MKRLSLVLLILLVLQTSALASEIEDALTELNAAVANLSTYKDQGAKLDKAIAVAMARRTQARLAEREAATDVRAALDRLQSLVGPIRQPAAAPVVYTRSPAPAPPPVVYAPPPRVIYYNAPAACAGGICPAVPW